jgi:hypothetical protein
LDSPGLTFYDREGNERAMLAVGSLSGGPSMTLTDGKSLASLSPGLVGLFAEDGTSGGLVREPDGSLRRPPRAIDTHLALVADRFGY